MAKQQTVPLPQSGTEYRITGKTMATTKPLTWPTRTLWRVNGEPFLDISQAQEYADWLENQGIKVNMTSEEYHP